MTKMPVKYIGPRGRPHGGGALWTEDKLDELRLLCERQASFDDLNAAFPRFGMSTLLIGMRTLVYRDGRRRLAEAAGLPG